MKLGANEKVASSISSERKKTTTCGRGAGCPTEARACAACRYQRRRCAPDCLLAPYFPAENHQQFINVHKLFGLKKLTKVLVKMTKPHNDLAINAMIFEANLRANDPVGGGYRMIQELKKQLELQIAELQFVIQRLDIHRAQAKQNQIQKFKTAAPARAIGDPQGENGNPEDVGLQNVYDVMETHFVQEEEFDYSDATLNNSTSGFIKAESKGSSCGVGVGVRVGEDVKLISQDPKVSISDKVVPKFEAHMSQQPEQESCDPKIEASIITNLSQ